MSTLTSGMDERSFRPAALMMGLMFHTYAFFVVVRIVRVDEHRRKCGDGGIVARAQGGNGTQRSTVDIGPEIIFLIHVIVT
jgi:hypothetical protein